MKKILLTSPLLLTTIVSCSENKTEITESVSRIFIPSILKKECGDTIYENNSALIIQEKTFFEVKVK